MNFLNIFRCTVALASLPFWLCSCDKQQETGKQLSTDSKPPVARGPGKPASVAPVEVSDLPELIRRLTKEGPGDEAAFLQFKETVKRYPRELLPLLLQLSSERRNGLITAFFEALAPADRVLALELLPPGLSVREQLDWARPVSTAWVRAGELAGAAAIINSRFPADARSSAIEDAIGALGGNTSAADALAFWAALDPHTAKDLKAGALASWLSRTDPVAAVKWYEGLNQRERMHALENVTSGSSEQLRQQYAVTSDETIRSRIIQRLGYLAARQHGDIAAEMQSIPAEQRADMEVSFVQGLFSEEGGRDPNALARLTEYRKGAVTQEAKDAADIIFAGQEFGRDPPAAISMLRREGLAERNVETWGSYVRHWLGANSQAASRYIDTLPAGVLRTEGIERIIEFLDDTGDKEAAAVWRKELPNSDGSTRPSP